MSSKKNWQEDLPVLCDTEVVVAGGGLSGCAAALAAARHGAKTLLVESGGCLGGAATSGLVAPISSVSSRSGKINFGGILWEVITAVTEAAKQYCHADGYSETATHMYKYVLLQKLQDSGVEMQFHVFVTDVVSKEDGSIDYIIVATKAGLMRINGRVFIDTTGDGDLMSKTTAQTIIGSEPNVLASITGEKNVSGDKIQKDDYVGKLQPVSLMMNMGNVDVPTGRQYMNKKLTYEALGITREAFAKWKYANTLGFEMNDTEYVPMPQGRVWLHPACRKGEAIINMSRVININACDPRNYSKAEVLAGLQLPAIIDFLQTFVPGFENAYFIESSNTLGIRESRRLVGDYILSGHDVMNCLCFDDTIAHASYIIDIHDPCGKRMAIGGPVHEDYYSIPYRTLVTSRVPNLATAGRSISADHVATSSTRVQGTAMLTGQAAGTAAAMAIQAECAMNAVNIKQLQAHLIADGVYISTSASKAGE